VDHVTGTQQDAAAAPDAVLPALLRAADCELPVLRATVADLARLEAMQERVPSNTLAATILRDPFLTLRVLRFMAQHRTRRQTADITTIAHAVMMLGQERFFRAFEKLPVLEQQVDGERLQRLLELASRARLAALLARDWAGSRHDVEPEEVMVAALLHTIPESLALLSGSTLAQTDDDHAALCGPLMRALAVTGLPSQMYERIDAPDVRRWNAQLACRLARHLCEGWAREAVAAGLAELQRLLRGSETQAWERVRRPLLVAAREWHYYGVPPAAANMLLAASESDPR
jgi:HD-like signal output (HDOD) protein